LKNKKTHSYNQLSSPSPARCHFPYFSWGPLFVNPFTGFGGLCTPDCGRLRFSNYNAKLHCRNIVYLQHGGVLTIVDRMTSLLAHCPARDISVPLSEIYCTYHVTDSTRTAAPGLLPLLVRPPGTVSWTLSAIRTPPKLL